MSRCCCCLVAQLCPTLCNPKDCSPPGFSINGILQARILKWVAISFSRGSSCPRDRTRISCLSRQTLSHWASREVQAYMHSTDKRQHSSWDASPQASWYRDDSVLSPSCTSPRLQHTCCWRSPEAEARIPRRWCYPLASTLYKVPEIGSLCLWHLVLLTYSW